MKRNKSPVADNVTSEEIQASGQHGIDIHKFLVLRVKKMVKIPNPKHNPNPKSYPNLELFNK